MSQSTKQKRQVYDGAQLQIIVIQQDRDFSREIRILESNRLVNLLISRFVNSKFVLSN